MRIRGGGCGDPFARDLGCTGPPLFWDEERRAALRAELDVFCFQLYGFDGQDTDYVLETSQPDKDGLKNNEAARFGTYRTKELVLETFDREDIGSKKFPGFASPRH